ncbi:YARHG domain-containing protein [Terrisporobacter hibernicus]|uniref:YARHG domain-containing protein n=1 Tax=Terrisporobacter hibernicus TaxID=2813371 RepID=A0AAX2ZHG8_9FIRM|nr:YARHG domain-containing protein [Terrisporobacter hibernicus]UEL48673.1 YARHG domain-containing protein [Terrisporobacter hibernicus]
MSKESCEKIIRGIAVNIASTLANQWKIIKEKQEKTLASKWEGSNFDEDTYIASLKSNLIFYKVSIRNREALLIKWIKSGLIPENEKRHEEFEILLKKCKEYVGRGIKSQGSTFNEGDKKALAHYENIDKNEARMYLEQEYKDFSLYSEVLSLFINDLSKSSLEEFSNIDSKEILKLIKSDILKATNYIKKSMDKVEEKTVLNSMESKFLQNLNEISEESLIQKMESAYDEACKMEEIQYDKGFGFNEDTIKDFIFTTILLDLVGEKEVLLFKGALRLLIGGEFGPINYREFTKYIIINKINISEKVYDDGIKIIDNSYKAAIENDLSKRSVNDNKNIDIEEYIYMLENADSSKKYNKKPAIEQEVSNLENDSEESTIKQYNNNVNRAFEPNNSSNKGKKIAIACVTVCAVVGLGVTAGLFIGGVLPIDKPKEKQETYTSAVEDVEEDAPEVAEVEEYNNDLENDQYFIVDSDSRYLTETELSAYTDEELSFIRNEIFARYGYVFKKDKYINYFSEKSWYTPDSTFQGNEEDFNNYEIKNIELIKSLESK